MSNLELSSHLVLEQTLHRGDRPLITIGLTPREFLNEISARLPLQLDAIIEISYRSKHISVLPLDVLVKPATFLFANCFLERDIEKPIVSSTVSNAFNRYCEDFVVRLIQKYSPGKDASSIVQAFNLFSEHSENLSLIYPDDYECFYKFSISMNSMGELYYSFEYHASVTEDYYSFTIDSDGELLK